MKDSERDFVLNSELLAASPESARAAVPTPARDLAPIDMPAISAMVADVSHLALNMPGPAASARSGSATGAVATGDGGVPIVELGGHSAPMALLELRRRLSGLRAGQEILVRWDSPGAALDLAAVGKVSGLVISAPDASATYRIKVK